MESHSVGVDLCPQMSDVKIPKNTKENRYYYAHREEVLARKKEQRMADPEYKARQEEKERKRKEKEEEHLRKEAEREAKRLTKMKALELKNLKLETKKNALLGISPRCE